MNFQEGVILAFDKPYRWTSFDVVGKIRWLICRRLGVKKLKVGHAGTLDPLATGVLIVCTGRATKRIEELQSGTKEYLATIRLGATTPSYDLEKPINATYPTEHITREMVEQVLERFIKTPKFRLRSFVHYSDTSVSVDSFCFLSSISSKILSKYSSSIMNFFLWIYKHRAIKIRGSAQQENLIASLVPIVRF